MTLIDGSPLRLIRFVSINVLIILTLFASITSGESVFQAKGGYLAHMDIERNSYTEQWMGFYGVISNNTMIIDNSNMNNNNHIQYIFSGISVSEGDYLIITMSPLPPELSGLRAGNINSVDKITGRGADSGLNTFKHSSSYLIPFSGTILVDVPSLYIFEGRDHYSREALLADNNGDPVFAVPIEPQDFNSDERHSFQLMLPQNGSITYYFFYLPSDTH